jgi:choline dehydrogenase-like flavoprotein
MGTPRLMLLSASARFPDGLANRSGLVGRNLMLHPYARVDGLFADPMGAWVSGEKAGIVSFQFYANDPARGFVRGLKLQLVGGPPPVALSLGAVTGTRLPWGAGHHAAFEGQFDRFAGFTVCAEDLAEPENRITLSPTLRDRDGLPAPKWIYRLSQNSRRALDFGMDRAVEVLNAAGAGEIFRTPLRAEAGFHIMGTARMGTDPETSVTDPWCRCHDVPNLWITDASTFVTSAAINPTATAQALALRAADRMIAIG